MTIVRPEDHNLLDTVADQLLVDQHGDIARDYATRQTVAEMTHGKLTRLGRETKSWAAASRDHFDIGVAMADWLTDEGWTPPAPIAVAADEHEGVDA